VRGRERGGEGGRERKRGRGGRFGKKRIHGDAYAKEG